MNKSNLSNLEFFESRFNVSYPVLEGATYISLVNYASDLKSPIQRWYRYKEGYSIQLMNKLFKEYGVKKGDLILDPFCGSGSTLIQAKLEKFESIGFEVNPFSAFLGRTKTQNYSKKDYDDFKKVKLLFFKMLDKNFIRKVELPKLSIVTKLFDADVLNALLSIRGEIGGIKNAKVRDLFSLAWLSILEEVSHYRKAGNGLKIRKEVKKIPRDMEFARNCLKIKLNEIEEDLPYAIKLSTGIDSPKIYDESALTIGSYVPQKSIKAVIFSPPYANCFDYTEIYKVELWMGGFVKDYSDLTLLRRKGVRSHLNGYLRDPEVVSHNLPELTSLIEELNACDLWDKRIPSMVNSYFDDMFAALSGIYASLKKGGYCAIVVSNSAYGGIVVPTDLLFASYAEKIGFKVLNIEVARFIITSSQQYKKTQKDKKYLRESIVHLKKI